MGALGASHVPQVSLVAYPRVGAVLPYTSVVMLVCDVGNSSNKTNKNKQTTATVVEIVNKSWTQ